MFDPTGRPEQVVYWRSSTWMGFGDLNFVLSGMPCLIAEDRTNALKVDPGWKPAAPPYSVGTVKLSMVSPLALFVPIGRDWATARTAPVCGWTIASAPTAAESVGSTWSLTALSAASW